MQKMVPEDDLDDMQKMVMRIPDGDRDDDITSEEEEKELRQASSNAEPLSTKNYGEVHDTEHSNTDQQILGT